MRSQTPPSPLSPQARCGGRRNASPRSSPPNDAQARFLLATNREVRDADADEHCRLPRPPFLFGPLAPFRGQYEFGIATTRHKNHKNREAEDVDEAQGFNSPPARLRCHPPSHQPASMHSRSACNPYRPNRTDYQTSTSLPCLPHLPRFQFPSPQVREQHSRTRALVRPGLQPGAVHRLPFILPGRMLPPSCGSERDDVHAQ